MLADDVRNRVKYEGKLGTTYPTFLKGAKAPKAGMRPMTSISQADGREGVGAGEVVRSSRQYLFRGPSVEDAPVSRARTILTMLYNNRQTGN